MNLDLKANLEGRVKFSFYRDGNLYYKTQCGVEFPIPISDAQGAVFLPEDRAILFMRWIRPYLIEIIKDMNRGDDAAIVR